MISDVVSERVIRGSSKNIVLDFLHIREYQFETTRRRFGWDRFIVLLFFYYFLTLFSFILYLFDSRAKKVQISEVKIIMVRMGLKLSLN